MAESGPVAWQLVCRSCGRRDLEGARQYCDECFGPLDLDFAWTHRDVDTVHASVADGPPTLWRYQPLLPVAGGVTAGWTPLVRARRLGEALGLEHLWLKDETRNPTGSFKDRLVATAVARAQATGATVVAAASTGNLARALVAGAHAAGLDAVVLVPSGAGVSGQGVLEVDGPYDEVNRLATEAAMRWESWAWVNVALRPWYLEGAATMAYEIAEQSGWRLPRHVVAPVASGGSLLRMARAFEALHRAGLASGSPPSISAVQPGGCAPVATAFAAGAADVSPLRPADVATVATSLAMGDPPDGPDLLAAIRARGGAAVGVAEDDILPAVELLAATEAIEVEPAGGVVVAALRLLRERGTLAPSDEVVACLTGSRAAGMQPGSLGVHIAPSLESLAAALPEHLKDRP